MLRDPTQTPSFFQKEGVWVKSVFGFFLRSAASIASFTKALRKPGLSTKSINDNLYKQTLQNYKNKINSLVVNCKSTV